MTRFKGYAGTLAVGFVFLALMAGCTPGAANMNPPTKTPVAPVGSTPAPSKSSPSTTTAETGHQIVVMTSKGFKPSTVTVKVGTRVVWSNDNTALHNLNLGGGVESGTIKIGGSAAHVFDKPGTYPYFDSLNPALKGVVIVK